DPYVEGCSCGLTLAGGLAYCACAAPTAEIRTLSLHDALPIYGRGGTGHHELPDFAYEFVACAVPGGHCHAEGAGLDLSLVDGQGDRKSTRLNSSHVKSSYAVFCLKKKKKIHLEEGNH